MLDFLDRPHVRSRSTAVDGTFDDFDDDDELIMMISK